MREILFKAKRKDNGEWIEGYYYKRIQGSKVVDAIEKYNGNIGSIEYYEIDPETICQFTGLRDKNGNKIFEEDIVRWDDDDECISVIRYDIESAAFVVDEYGVNGCLMEYGWDETAGDFEKIETNGFDDYSNLDFEIIGNVFDSPELLER